MTGGLFGCPNLSLCFAKEGYNKLTKKYKSCCTDNAIIVLEKTDNMLKINDKTPFPLFGSKKWTKPTPQGEVAKNCSALDNR